MENETQRTGTDASDVRGLKKGDAAAIERLWADYFQRLVGLARKYLPKDSRRAADEEDVALSAFQSFCKGAAAGQFPKLDDREDLWRLLVVITLRKARRVTRRGQAQKHGGGRISDSAFFPDGRSQSPGSLAEVLAAGPTPAFAAELGVRAIALATRRRAAQVDRALEDGGVHRRRDRPENVMQKPFG
jgi:hypothetical protein